MSEKVAKLMRKRLANELEARCVASARAIFRILGANADKLPMGDNLDRDEVVNIMVPVVDEIAKALADNNIRPSEWNRVKQYMALPISEYEWRMVEYLQGFKDLILSKTVGKDIYDITITDLQNKVLEMYSKPALEVFEEKDKALEEAEKAEEEKSTGENIDKAEDK